LRRIGEWFAAETETLGACAPGLALCAVLGAAALGLATQAGSGVVWALLLGMLIAAVWSPTPRVSPGIDLTARTILRVGVALLGAQVSADVVRALDAGTMAILAGGIAVVLAAGLLSAKVLGLGRELALVAAASVAICGASAAVAFGHVLARRETRDRDVACTVGAVSILSMIAMLLYPYVASILSFDQTAAGIFLGGTIQEVPHAVAAGYAVDPLTGSVATTTKLFRVALLGPTLMLVTVVAAAHAAPGSAPTPLLPPFLVAFAALALCNVIGILPRAVTEPLGHISRFLLVMAMAAIGLKLEWRSIASYGWAPVLLLTALSALLVILVGGYLMLVRG
jgi:uncharacterized integral membrane protein (TIGR00698 family)